MRTTAIVVFTLLAAAANAGAQDLVIRRWLIRGPLPAPDGEGRVERDYLGGEASIMPTVGDDGWAEVEADEFGRLDLNEVFAGQSTAWGAAYAHTWVFAPQDRTVLLVADSDDDLVVRLNGQRVWTNVVARGLGRGNDTITVRLAQGWNSLLLKPLNRSGGFGLLGRLAPAESSGLDGLLLTLARPPGLLAYNHPRRTATVGPILARAALSWRGGQLYAPARLPLAAWGAEAFPQLTLEVSQSGRTLSRHSQASLAPGAPLEIELELEFNDLRAAALGEAPFTTRTTWQGGSTLSSLYMDADRLLRLLGGRIEIGSWQVDSAGGTVQRLTAQLIVPGVVGGLSLDLLSLGLGSGATYRVNGEEAEWRDGVVALCARCAGGIPLSIEIEPEPNRPVWALPEARVREIGYVEYADGYDYAAALAGRAPAIERPDPGVWLRALGDPTGMSFRQLSGRYAQAYAPLAAEIRRDTLHLIGNSHIDAAWLWPWSETVDVIRNTWRTSLKLAEMFPGYIFTGSSAAYYDAMDRLAPALADSLVAAVERGRWVPVGGWWVESDLNLPSGESLVRQGLYGQRYFERRFGARSRVAWTPDCFGYPWTIPQILRGAGLEYFVTQKIRWNDSTEFPHNAFHWQGLDGSRVLTYNPYGYVHNLDPERLVSERIEDRQRTGSNHQIVLYGVGDHGGGPTIAMLQRAEDLRRVPTFPVLLYDKPLSALQAVEGRGVATQLPVWDDELYLEYHRGTYTTQARSKARNRRSEVMLQTTEALLTIGTVAYPRQTLEDAWRLVLFNQFHDILPGSGIREVYRDAEAFYDSAWAIIDSLSAVGFADLRRRLDTRGRGQAVVV
ncbi:MAG: hypothetical protein JSU87_13725, partial [Gemmatimonadota bacterium]